MAFARANLNLSSSGAADAPKIWTYKSADALATINTSGYFNSATRELNVGDIDYKDVTEDQKSIIRKSLVYSLWKVRIEFSRLGKAIIESIGIESNV